MLVENTPIEEQTQCSSFIRALGGNTNELLIAKHKSGFISLSQFKNIIRNGLKEIVIIGDSGFNLLERKHGQIQLQDNVFVADCGYPGILQCRPNDRWIDWPKNHSDRFHERTLQGLLEDAFSQVWGVSLNDVISASDISSDKVKYSFIIGSHNGNDIAYEHADIIRLPLTSQSQ